MNKVDSAAKMREMIFGGSERGPGARASREPDVRAIREILEKRGNMPSQIIGILQDVQARFHYLPEAELRFISRELDIPLARLYAIATFYKAFRLSPRGRHEIALCMGTACHVRGAVRVKDSIERALNIKAGETTRDMRFSFETVRCLGCCGQAPVMMVDEELVTKLDHLTVGAELERYR